MRYRVEYLVESTEEETVCWSIDTRGTLEGYKRISSRQKWLEVHGRKKWAYYYDPRSLAKQREYYSERAITEAELAIARVLNELDHLCARDNADQVMSTLLRKFDVVTNLSAWSDPAQLH